MRPLVAMATFVLLLGLMPVLAQHGGGHVSAGGHASAGGHSGMAGHGGFSGHAGGQTFSGAHSGFGGVHSGFGGVHSGSGFAGRPSGRVSPSSRPPLVSRDFNRFRGRPRGPRIRNRGFGNGCFGFGCGWGYGYPYYPYLGGGIDPYWWWDSGSPDDQNQPYGSGPSNEVNGQNNDQRGDESGDQDAYARSAPPPHVDERTEAGPATVLVFRDQHKQEVQNYAIVGQTLWNFAPQHTQKIPLSDLDLPATTKANDERGVDFHVPGAHEGQ